MTMLCPDTDTCGFEGSEGRRKGGRNALDILLCCASKGCMDGKAVVIVVDSPCVRPWEHRYHAEKHGIHCNALLAELLSPEPVCCRDMSWCNDTRNRPNAYNTGTERMSVPSRETLLHPNAAHHCQ